jgi:hypothetical protein
VLVTQLYVMAKVFAAKKIVLSGRVNTYFPMYQFVACDDGGDISLTWGNRFEGIASLRN